LIFGEIEMRFEPFAPRGIVAARTQRADIERRRSDRFHQREIVELRVVRERDHGATLVEFHVENGVVRHLAHERRARQMPHVGIFLARIARGRSDRPRCSRPKPNPPPSRPSRMASIAPSGRGDEPHVLTTVTSSTRRPLSIQRALAFSTSRLTLSINTSCGCPA
jgi:hypothetical protein